MFLFTITIYHSRLSDPRQFFMTPKNLAEKRSLGSESFPPRKKMLTLRSLVHSICGNSEKESDFYGMQRFTLACPIGLSVFDFFIGLL